MAHRAHGRWQGPEQLEPRQLMASVFWDGGAGTTSWHDAANWSTDALPGPNDDVVINVTGSTANITHSQAVFTSVKSITNNEAFALSAGTISTAGTWKQNGPMTVSGGRVAGGGQLQVKAGLAWSGGRMTGAGTTLILPTGQVTISGTVTLARSLVNDGGATWASGNIRFESGSLNNRVGRTLNVQSAGSMLSVSGTNLLANNGTLRRNGTSGSISTLGVRLTSTGAVQVLQGTLRLLGGGAAFAGSFDAATASARVALGTIGYIWNAPVTLSGPGRYVFQSGVHIVNGTFAGAGGVGGIEVYGAELRLQAVDRTVGTVILGAGWLHVTHTLAVAAGGAMTWSSGVLKGGGRVVIGDGAAMSIEGSTVWKPLDVVLLNEGTVDWTVGTINARPLGRIENRGTFNVFNATFHAQGATPGPGEREFNNAGTLRKLGGGTFTLSGGTTFNNLPGGTLDIQAGTVGIGVGGTNRGTINGTLNGALVVTGGRAFSMLSGAIGGVPSVTVTGTLDWSAGAINGPGQLIVAASGQLRFVGGGLRILARAVSNSGTITWSGGTLRLDGGVIFNGSSGTFHASAAGVVNAAGTGNAFTNEGLVRKSGAGGFTLAPGLVQVTNVGTITVEGGSLTLEASRVTQVVGTRLIGGTWNAVNGAALDILGVALEKNEAVVTIGGSGAAFDALASMKENLGSLNINATTFSLAPVGGAFTNSGTLRLTAAGRVNVTGRVVLVATSKLITGLTSATAFGRITATGTITLSGLATALFTYTPAIGSGFDFMTGSGRTGEFSARTSIGLPSGLQAALEYAIGTARWRVQAS